MGCVQSQAVNPSKPKQRAGKGEAGEGVDIKVFGEKEPDEATTLIRALGEDEPDEATTLDEALGEDDEATAYNNIGLDYDLAYYKRERKGTKEMALEHLENNLAIQIKTMGRDHMDVATIHGDIGGVYETQRMFEMALEQYEKCLAIQIKRLGVGHVLVAETKLKIATLLVLQVNHVRAGVLFRESAAIYRTVHGAEHSKTRDALHRASSSEAVAIMMKSNPGIQHASTS
ncbi:hypothetical protein T484DRAFT_1852450 [Baffinella frigidus]|nr:hypothetical protein T484DRAFT_1852450 [Cryptophyta sp. CCMP2293]